MLSQAPGYRVQELIFNSRSVDGDIAHPAMSVAHAPSKELTIPIKGTNDFEGDCEMTSRRTVIISKEG